MMALVSFLRLSSVVVIASGSLIGSNLRKQDGSEKQALLGADVPFRMTTDKPLPDPYLTSPNARLEKGVNQDQPYGVCKVNTDCETGCFCGTGLCRQFGGAPDRRCNSQHNGFDLGDGGFCWDGRRDVYCMAQATQAEQAVTPETSKERKKGKGGEGEDNILEKQMEQAEKDTEHTIKKAKKMDPADMAMDDVERFFNYLMPGKRPNVYKKLTELTIVMGAVLWFVFFRYVLYQDDRCPKHDRWSKYEPVVRQDDERIKLMKPDIVLVFHKPDFEYGDKENEVHATVLENALVGKDGSLPRSEALLEAALRHHQKTSVWRKLKKSAAKAKEGLSARSKGSDEAVEDAEQMMSPRSEDSESTGIKMGDFRSALVQDICEHLPPKGFDIAAFASVDNDELFLCIGLRNEVTIKQHLQRYGMKLQLRPECIEKLDIDQPPDEIESSPPLIRYDRRLAENVFGSGSTDLDVYKNWGQHGGRPVIISGTDRIRIIHQHLNGLLNLDYAVSNKLLVQWYPAHNESRLAELEQSWARWSLLSDITVRQPVSAIRDYYGSRVAFIFAWMGTYTKMLVCLLPVALVWTFLNLFTKHYVGKTDFWHRGSVMGISIAIIIWAKLANNLWKQDEEFLKVLWGLNHMDKDKSERPDFHGVLLPDPTDGNKRSLQYPGWKYGLRKAISWGVTLSFCTLVFCCVVMWLDLFSGRMNLAASICQAIMVQVFTQIFNVMAEGLTVAENHKFQDDFYTSYLVKMFVFQLVNQYSAFFYMAVKQQFSPKGCPDDDCVGLIQASLPMTLAVLAVLQFVQVFVGTLMVKFNLWYEGYQMKANGMEAATYSFVEEQAKYGQFRVREQIEVMTQLSLTLGYILIFGCVAPRIVPLCLLVFMLQLRASGILMTTALKRTVPRMTVGIGQWNEVFYFLMLLGVLFSAYLLVQFAPLFQGTFLLTKLTGFFIYLMLIGAIWACVDLTCPPTDPRSGLLDDRRHVVEHKVMALQEDKNFEEAQRKQVKHGEAGLAHAGTTFHTEEIVKNAVTYIPKLIPTDKSPRHESHNQGPQ